MSVFERVQTEKRHNSGITQTTRRLAARSLFKAYWKVRSKADRGAETNSELWHFQWFMTEINDTKSHKLYRNIIKSQNRTVSSGRCFKTRWSEQSVYGTVDATSSHVTSSHTDNQSNSRTGWHHAVWVQFKIHRQHDDFEVEKTTQKQFVGQRREPVPRVLDFTL